MKLRNTLILLLTLIAVPTCAQDRLSTASPSSEKTYTKTAEYDLKRGTNEFGFWLGLAPNATTQLGGLRDAQARGLRLDLAGLRYGIVVASTKRFASEYTLDVIPAATLMGAYVRCPDQMNPNCNLSPHATDTRVRKAAYAFGIAPVGFKFNLMPKHRLQPFVSLVG